MSRLGTIAVLGALGLVATGCSGAVSDDTKVLTVSVPRSESHSLSLVMKGWAEEIEAATDNGITFEFNYDSALCPEGDAVECIGSGRADAGQSSPAWEPAKFPLTTVGEVGFASADVAAVTKAVNALAQESDEIQSEYTNQNQKLLFFTALNPLIVATSEQVDTLADLRNLSLRTPGVWPRIAEPLGVAPVAMPQTEQYESIQRGVIDGTITTLDGALEGSLFEVAPYYGAVGEYVGSNILASFTMNADVYENLSEDERAAVDKASDNVVAAWYSDYLAPENERVCEALRAEGATISTIGTGEEAEPWVRAARQATEDNWKAGASAAEDPDAMIARFRELVDQSIGDSGGPVNGVQACIGGPGTPRP
ncbi:TRAP transporter substrate-binding protein DctP [Rhodococcus sp. SJ-2]